MTEDWYVISIDRVEAAAHAGQEALDRVVQALGVARRERVAGLPLPDIINGLVARGGRDTRRNAPEAFAVYEAAVRAYRAQAIYALVAEEGMTFSDVASRVGVSRQMVARLYAKLLTNSETEDGGDIFVQDVWS